MCVLSIDQVLSDVHWPCQCDKLPHTTGTPDADLQNIKLLTLNKGGDTTALWKKDLELKRLQ